MMIEHFKMNILIDNESSSPDLFAEHGLSIHLEFESGHSVLFDSGESGRFAENARTMGIDLSRIDAAALSHGHYDHTGGLPALANMIQGCPLFFHPEAFGERFHHEIGEVREAIGMPHETRVALERAGIFSLRPTREAVEIVTGCWFSGEIPRCPGSLGPSGDDFRLADGSSDPLVDDAALYVCTTAGTVLICGCAHAGLESILHRVRLLTQGVPIIGIVGGLHLRSATPDELSRLPSLLDSYGVQFLAGCHCTGSASLRWLGESWKGGKVLSPVTGTQLLIAGGQIATADWPKRPGH